MIFLHVGKTAGTTIRQILRRQYPPRDTLVILNPPLRDAGRSERLTRERTLDYFASLPEAERNRPSLIIGHIVFGLHRFISRPATYFTLLRDPVALTVSQYNFVRRTPNHPLHDDARTRSLEDYVKSGISLETDNSQTRALSGDRTTPFGGCTERLLSEARSNAEASFAVVGLVERFDESLLLLKDAFGWRDPFYLRTNVSRARKDPLPSGVRARIEEQNRFDMELYSWATARFQRTVEETPDLEDALQRFHRANRSHAPIGWLTEALPRQIVRSARRVAKK